MARDLKKEVERLVAIELAANEVVKGAGCMCPERYGEKWEALKSALKPLPCAYCHADSEVVSILTVCEDCLVGVRNAAVEEAAREVEKQVDGLMKQGLAADIRALKRELPSCAEDKGE